MMLHPKWKVTFRKVVSSSVNKKEYNLTEDLLTPKEPISLLLTSAALKLQRPHQRSPRVKLLKIIIWYVCIYTEYVITYLFYNLLPKYQLDNY